MKRLTISVPIILLILAMTLSICVLSLGPDDTHPTWSPDGTRIAYASGRFSHTQVYVMKLEDRKVTQVTHASESLGLLKPIWSPDGTQISYQADMDQVNHPNRDIEQRIYITSLDGTNQTRLPVSDAHTYFDVAWSPDGAMVYFPMTPDPTLPIAASTSGYLARRRSHYA